VNGLGILQALPDQVDVSLRGSNPARRFLLKGVQDEQDALKLHGVDGPIRIAVEVVADFEDPAKTLQRFRIIRMIPELRFKKGLPDLATNGGGERLRGLSGWLEPPKIAGLGERNRSFTGL
jgi:hypothetical protein